MNLQDERIQAACDVLALNPVAERYPALAPEAVDNDASFVDFLERCWKAEQDERRSGSRAMLAGFPSIKLIDDYDFKFAAGAPKTVSA